MALKEFLAIPEFAVDIAASHENSVAPICFTEDDSAFDKTWNFGGKWGFCNPPFGNIRPWVKKAFEETTNGAMIAMLVPASVGANWWLDYVDYKAYTYFLNGRLTFVGETTPYPKDCALLLWAPFLYGGYHTWNWRS